MIIAALELLQNLASRPADAGTDVPSYGDAFFRMILSLAVILALLFVIAKVLPRWLAARRRVSAGKMMEVVDAIALERNRSLYLVKVAGQYYLVGSAEGRLSTLGEPQIDEESARALARAAEAGEPRGPSFKEFLHGGGAAAANKE